MLVVVQGVCATIAETVILVPSQKYTAPLWKLLLSLLFLYCTPKSALRGGHAALLRNPEGNKMTLLKLVDVGYIIYNL